MPDQTSAQLFLYRYAQGAWDLAVGPWLRACGQNLTRSYVVVPTRGQAHGIKQKCLDASLPLLGVEFLTPGLARKKWLSQVRAAGAPRNAAGRETLLLGLETLVEQRLSPLESTDPAWGFWKSFQSDLERALDDFDDLLKAGFKPSDFPIKALGELFAELAEWVDQLGFDLAPLQGERAGLTPVGEEETRLGQRLLVYGLSAELWSEFFNVAAFARRFREITVLLPTPEFRGKNEIDERWVELWQALLGAEAEPLDESDPAQHCGDIGQLLSGAPNVLRGLNGTHRKAKVMVGPSRFDEMAHVASETEQLLKSGAESIGIIFPSADAAHFLLCGLLHRRKIEFTSALEINAPVGAESAVQRAVAQFYLNGARIDDVLELWPLLLGVGYTTVKLSEIRTACERLFEEQQTHSLDTYRLQIEASEKPALRELQRLNSVLLPAFPERSAIAPLVKRFSEVCENLGVGVPLELTTLVGVGDRDPREYSSKILLHSLLSFLRPGQVSKSASTTTFARVSLTTRRRADALPFSHLIFVEANAGVWPRQAESSPWLTDDDRKALNTKSKYSIGLYTAEDRGALERQSFLRMARDTKNEILFTAAVYDEADPEMRLGPNSWLERVLWTDPTLRSAKCSMDDLFWRLSKAADERRGGISDITAARDAWFARRNPSVPFDQHFCSADPKVVPPNPIAARVLERGVKDPAELWFGSIFEAKRVEWQMFTRARKRSLGQWVHKILAAGLDPGRAPGVFGPRVSADVARERIRVALDRLRAVWPDDLYWKSYHLELSHAVELIFEAIEDISNAGFAATELTLPATATVSIGSGLVVRIKGRVDYIVADRETWSGARVDIVDFKTGADANVSAKRIANEGRGLQLALYLAAAQRLGASDGQVWMAKPAVPPLSSMPMAELPQAMSGLTQVEQHIKTGVYGSLTPSRSEYEPEGFRWPLACAPVAFDILLAKHALFQKRIMEEGP